MINNTLQSSGKINTIVTVGEDNQVSMQLLQDIYNEITGKTEKLTKRIRTNHQSTFDDICQLNMKITQLYEQYQIVSSNCTVTLFHISDAKEKFSSFKRFKVHDSTSLSAVENIRLKYSFLIVLPKTKRPQSYDIEIDISSRAAIHQRSELETGISKRLMLFFAPWTGLIEIEYVDYTVARNFLVAIEHWFNALPQGKSIPGIFLLKQYSEYFPFLFRYISAFSGNYHLDIVNIDGYRQATGQRRD